MSKKLAIVLCLILTLWGIPQTDKTLADDISSCSSLGIKVDISYKYKDLLYPLKDPTKNIIPDGVGAISLKFSGIQDQHTYLWDSHDKQSTQGNPATDGTMTLTASDPDLLKRGQHDGWLRYQDSNNNFAPYCKDINYHIGNDYKGTDCILNLTPSSNVSNSKLVIPENRPITAIISHVPTGTYSIFYSRDFDGISSKPPDVTIDAAGNGSFIFQSPDKPSDNANISLGLIAEITLSYCPTSFNIRPSSELVKPTCTIFPNKDHITTLDDLQIIATNLPPYQEYWTTIINKTTQKETQLPNKVAVGKNSIAHLWLSQKHNLPEGKYEAQVFASFSETPQCTSGEFTVNPPDVAISEHVKQCGEKDANGKEIICSKAGGDPCPDPDKTRGPAFKTAIGCVHTNPAEFVKDLMKFVIGIGGGLAFLMMLLGAYQMLSSAGNPETLKAGQDRLTSAVIGLLFIIFTVLLLQIIGLDILAIPGFGNGK